VKGKKKKKAKIVEGASVPLHFKEMIDRIKKKQKLEIADLTQFYLVDLLSKFLLSANLFPEMKKKPIDEPLALQLYKALEEKSPEEKIALLKKMGDFALYISGFFQEYLGAKPVDLDYYTTMGESAYGAVFELSRSDSKKKIVAGIFDELSSKFKRIVDLLAEVSELSFIATDKDLIKLYEKWAKTKSPRLKKKLMDKGVLPVSKKSEEKDK